MKCATWPDALFLPQNVQMITLSDALFLPQNVQIIKSMFRAREDELLSIETSVDSPLEERALRPLLEEVAGEVNSLLDANFGLPSIIKDETQEKSGYLNGQIGVGYNEMFLNDIYAIISHEYMHHIAKLCIASGSDWNQSKALEEGMARGVELKIADLYAEKLDSACFKRKALLRVLKDMAMLIDKAAGKQRPAKLTSDPMLDFFDVKEENFGKYKYGTSALLLAEHMHGDIVYKRLVKSMRPYRLLVGFLSGEVKP